jgi:uncharacterized membrane protein
MGFLQPILLTGENFSSKFLLKNLYSKVCHQKSFKCIEINNALMLVCARCTGIYFGILLTGLLTLFNKIRLLSNKILMLAALPLLADVLFTFTGIYDYSKYLALSTGLILGSGVYLFLISEIENLFSKKSLKGNE